MKINEFGLWFSYMSRGLREWTLAPPLEDGFRIYYDGMLLGRQSSYFLLNITQWKPYIINLNKKSTYPEAIWVSCFLDHQLTLDDFQIIPNAYYRPRRSK
jgi:hypothetical protein